MEMQQQCRYNRGLSMQPGKNTATDEVVEPLAHPALARRAGIRDAQGCGWPTMPGLWERLAQN